MPLEPPLVYFTTPLSSSQLPSNSSPTATPSASFSSTSCSPSSPSHGVAVAGQHHSPQPSALPLSFPSSSPVLLPLPPSTSGSSSPAASSSSSHPPCVEPTLVDEIHDHTQPQSLCHVPFLMGFIDTLLNFCDGGRGEFPYSSQPVSCYSPPGSPLRSQSASVRPRRYRTIRRTPYSRLALFPPPTPAYVSSPRHLLTSSSPPLPPLVRSYSETDADVWTGSPGAYVYASQTEEQDPYGNPLKSPASIARDMMMRSQTPYYHTVYTHAASKPRYASVPPPPRTTYTIHDTSPGAVPPSASTCYYTSHGQPQQHPIRAATGGGASEVLPAGHTYYYTSSGGERQKVTVDTPATGVALGPGRTSYTMAAAGTGEGYGGISAGGRRLYDGLIEHEEATAAALLKKEAELQRRIDEKQVQLRLLQRQLDAAAAGTTPTASSPLSAGLRAAGGGLGAGRGGEEEQEDIRKLRIDLCEKELELEELRTEMNLKKKEKTQQDLDDIMKGGGSQSTHAGGRNRERGASGDLNHPSATGRCVSCSPSSYDDQNAKRREEALKHLIEQKEEENRLLARRIEGLRDERRDMKELLIQKDRQLAAAIGSTDPDCKEASAVQLGVKAISMVQDNVELKEKIRVLEADVVSLQDEKQKREALLDETFKKLNDKRTEAAGLLEMISQRDMKIARVETFLQQRNRDYEKLQEKSRVALETERERVLRGQEEIRILEEQQVALKNVIASRDEKVLCLQNEVVRRDAIIKQLEQRTKVLTKDLDQSTLHLQQMLRASAAKDAYLHELETHLRQNEVERQTSYLAEISRTRQMALETRLKEEECRNALNEKEEVLTSVKHELNRSSHTLQQIRQAFEGIEYTDQCYRPILNVSSSSSSSSSPSPDPYLFLPSQHREISSSPSSPSQKAALAKRGEGSREFLHQSLAGGVSLPTAEGGGGRTGMVTGEKKSFFATNPGESSSSSLTAIPQRPLHESLQALHADFLLNGHTGNGDHHHLTSPVAASSPSPLLHQYSLSHQTPPAGIPSTASASPVMPPLQGAGGEGVSAYAGVLRQTTTSSGGGGGGNVRKGGGGTTAAGYQASSS
ncbi:high molecular mass nuclear [Cystoisospora suis]|uniref:High molecular mass nuclear n=1 Tax=Cystoisospora suis TaxID=483139 RepID=A0A2C6KSG3_9APIC|nr:high molecular mass nuclear [Cystoisospora suis]